MPFPDRAMPIGALAGTEACWGINVGYLAACDLLADSRREDLRRLRPRCSPSLRRRTATWKSSARPSESRAASTIDRLGVLGGEVPPAADRKSSLCCGVCRRNKMRSGTAAGFCGNFFGNNEPKRAQRPSVEQKSLANPHGASGGLGFARPTVPEVQERRRRPTAADPL